MNSRPTCGIVIYDSKERAVRVCGARSTHALIVRGDQLFSVCSRHDKRLARAFPNVWPDRQLREREEPA